MEIIDKLIEMLSKPATWFGIGIIFLPTYYDNKKKKYLKEQEEKWTYTKNNEWREELGLEPWSLEEWEDSEREGSGSNTKDKKPLNQIQKICILVVVACFWLWVGFGDGFRPQYSVVAFAIGITSIVAFFLFKDK